MPLTDGYYSLGRGDNTVSSPDTESSVSELTPELELNMSDEELLALKDKWLKSWGDYSKEVEKIQSENENYWLGKQFSEAGEERPLVDNLIFESLETFLPIATRQKAEPLVEGDDTPESQEIADKVRKMLIYLGDTLTINLKMKQVARYWALYLLGVMKVGWSMKENDITCRAIRPQKLILEPDATIEEGEYTGYYIGEWLEDTASDLIARFPAKKDKILEKVDSKMGTKIKYLQWWTNDYVFWTMDKEVLDKKQNPHWNYDTEEPMPVDEFGVAPVNEDGTPIMQPVVGKNHFNTSKMPYVFLSIFNLGKHPHDDTNLVKQNIALQDLINKRLLQIDKNADSANGGLVVSGDAFTEEQAKKASKTLRKGGTIWVPTGDVNNSVKRDPATALPSFVYESLVDYRNELRNIFGTRGSTPQGTIAEETVGGKNIIRGQDSDRIGGGISTYLEQFADKVFNWFVQLMYVYYDEPHYASVLGDERAKEYIGLSSADLNGKLIVSVKDGSMIPKDPVSQRGEAVELWGQKGIDPITFFERLEFPNPRESAKQLYLWQADPIRLFPDLYEEQMAMQQQQMADQQAKEQGMMEEQQILAERDKEVDHINNLEKEGFKGLVKADGVGPW